MSEQFGFSKIEIPEDKNRKEMSSRNREMVSMVTGICDLLKKEGIDNWVIGGFAVEGYRGETEREHQDIDFIIWEKDKEKVEGLLAKNGFELISGWIDEKGEAHPYLHKILARKSGIQIDLVAVGYDEQRNSVYPTEFPEYIFPREFLDGGNARIKDSAFDQEFYFNVPREELLLALKINSQREQDQSDIKFLERLIDNQERVDEIKSKYGFDHERFSAAMNK